MQALFGPSFSPLALKVALEDMLFKQIKIWQIMVVLFLFF